jgi:hypothetical protein
MDDTPRHANEPQLDAFRDAEAAFRLSASDATRAALVDAAVGLMVAGVESPNLATLAGADFDDYYEVRNYLDATIRDLGLAVLDDRSIAIRTIDRIVRNVMDGSLAPRAGAAAIYDAWLPAAHLLGPDLSHLATIADYLDDGWETWGPPADVFLRALAMDRSGDPVEHWDLVTREFVGGA